MAKSVTTRQTSVLSKRKITTQENEQHNRIQKRSAATAGLRAGNDIRAFGFRATKTDVDVLDKSYKPVLVENGAACRKGITRLRTELDKLNTLFVAIDKMLWVSYGGDIVGATIPFSEVKRQVECACRRQCNLVDLQKILHIYPDAYQITRKLSTPDYIIEFVPSNNIKPSQDSEFLACRERMFEILCADFEKTADQQEVPLHPLPSSQKFGNAAHRLISNRESLRKNASDVKILLRGENFKKPAFTATSVATREQNLLERIRAKQAAREEAQKFTVSPAVAGKCAALGRVPAIVDILLQLQAGSVSDGVMHVSLRKVVELVRDSIRASGVPPSANDVTEAVEVLGQIVPQWCSVVTVGVVSSVKLTTREMCGLAREDILAKTCAERSRLLQ
ncbi:hypothetical protein V1506DRAFT_528949 [Lipomyces tetrasporus]